MKLFNFLFDPTRDLKSAVAKINGHEQAITALDDGALRTKSLELKSKGTSDDDMFLAFALVREAAKRTLKQRHFDVQLMGGIALHQGKIAEMATGEGKTLASTAPIYFNALSGKGVHVVTVNEYLAKRDTVWMGQIYHLLGLKVACLVHEGALLYDPEFRIPEGQEALIDKERDTTGSFLVQQEYLRPISRKEAYAADITYGTNHEFGFDYLRDNLAYTTDQQVQREHHFAVIDEIDSILIDEARTPLIISAPDAESSEYYKTFTRIVAGLAAGEDYITDEKMKSVDITESGINKIEKTLKVDNLYGPEHLRLTHYLQESLRAHALYRKDRDYVVKGNDIIIVDQFTGRLMLGRRYSGGLHQAIEAKEGVLVQNESRTYAQITIQNYFRLYKKLAGMTGTAETSAEEFDKVYGLKVIRIPTNRPLVRKDESDFIYKNEAAKYQAVIKEIKERQAAGQPILVGTVSIEKNEMLSTLLSRAGIRHEALNAKNHEREGQIIAQAGRRGAVTVATNLAGRGVDIVLGGNPVDPIESSKVKDLGGLYVIGTERHEARRIDNQLRGRSGRQGDPGVSRFFLSLEDDLMRIFGGNRLKGFMERLNVPDDMPIESKLVSSSVSQAQARVEGFNFDARKHLLEYDDVLNKQRMAIYARRRELLAQLVHPQVLGTLDLFWMNHLENMEALRESVKLRAYGQHDPLVEYRRESRMLYQRMIEEFDQWMEENKEKIAALGTAEKNLNQPIIPIAASSADPKYQNIGRNDPCPCGSGKKFKKCHGK